MMRGGFILHLMVVFGMMITFFLIIKDMIYMVARMINMEYIYQDLVGMKSIIAMKMKWKSILIQKYILNYLII